MLCNIYSQHKSSSFCTRTNAWMKWLVDFEWKYCWCTFLKQSISGIILRENNSVSQFRFPPLLRGYDFTRVREVLNTNALQQLEELLVLRSQFISIGFPILFPRSYWTIHWYVSSFYREAFASSPSALTISQVAMKILYFGGSPFSDLRTTGWSFYGCDDARSKWSGLPILYCNGKVQNDKLTIQKTKHKAFLHWHIMTSIRLWPNLTTWTHCQYVRNWNCWEYHNTNHGRKTLISMEDGPIRTRGRQNQTIRRFGA